MHSPFLLTEIITKTVYTQRESIPLKGKLNINTIKYIKNIVLIANALYA